MNSTYSTSLIRRNIFCFFVFITILFGSRYNAQNLISGAESVAYHAGTNSYYVSSLLNNKIIKIDQGGNQSLYYDNIIAFSNCIKGDILYVSSGSDINGIDLNTGLLTFNVHVDGAQQFDGITYDNNGFLYAVETRSNLIYKIDIVQKTYTLFVDDGLEPSTQDLIYDPFKDRILVCAFALNSKVLSLNPHDGSLSTAIESWGQFDGIAIDDNGFIYLDTYVDGGKVLLYDNDFSIGPIVIAEGLGEPAGLDFDPVNSKIAVPTFTGSSVEFFDIPEEYLYVTAASDIRTGHAPLAVQFTQKSVTNQTINSWEWDFDNDGTIDSQEENPAHLFTTPGTYSVKLTISSNKLQQTIILENFIEVFNGESALGLNGEKDGTVIPAIPQIELYDKFTFEAVIKPEEMKASLIFDKSAFKLYLYGTAIGPIGDNSITIDLKTVDGKTVKLTAPDNSIELNKWQHIAFTFDASTDEAKLFINGAETSLSVVGANQIGSELFPNSDNDLIIGNDENYSRGFNGAIDEIRLWNVARTQEEIQMNMDNHLIGSEFGLIGYWKINEGNGATLNDDSPIANNGIIQSGKYVQGVDLSSLTDIEDGNLTKSIPTDFTLFQNYPNPFNPTTVISYQLSVSGKVTLKVYDVLGEEIATLVDEYQTAGIHHSTFSTLHYSLPSGVYFYKLTAGNFISIKKLMLLK
ncbi:MAG: LamG-like jellyroll fold domain-containing protein [bacterium]